MAHTLSRDSLRAYRPGPIAQLLLGLAVALAIALWAIGPERLLAQIEGERGIAPIASSSDIQVSGIKVNVKGKTGAEARDEGWKLAQRKAWEKMDGPKISDSQLDSMVVAIVIENEQIGPRRYVATLGVIFDRSKAGQLIGSAGGGSVRTGSVPMLTIPILYSGGVRQVFEVRGPWQRAWANFQTAASPIDYVRPSGAGGDSLILTAGQPGRRSRLWWRNVLDQFEAADVLVPVARLERQWPGGPIRGTFTARYGPDNRHLESFELSADDEQGLTDMLNAAIVRIDLVYRKALADGRLKPDPTLFAEDRAFDAAIALLRAKLGGKSGEPDAQREVDTNTPAAAASAAPTQAANSTYSVQFSTPDAAAVDSALAAVRGVPGVRSAAITSLAINGTSVMRVTVAGDLNALAAALRAQGWQVTTGNNALRISR